MANKEVKRFVTIKGLIQTLEKYRAMFGENIPVLMCYDDKLDGPSISQISGFNMISLGIDKEHSEPTGIITNLTPEEFRGFFPRNDQEED